MVVITCYHNCSNYTEKYRKEIRNLVFSACTRIDQKIQLTTQIAVNESLLLFVFYGEKSVGPIITHSSVFGSPIIQ